MRKKHFFAILATSSALIVLYNLLKISCRQKGNQIIPSSSGLSAIFTTQNAYRMR